MREVESTVRCHVVTNVDRVAAPAPAADAGVRTDRPVCAFVASDPRADMRDERVAELRQRVRDGVYETRSVVEQVARRILESGDL